MKILEVCHYSAGICGVWSRVREESLRLAKRGHEVRVYSSNFYKGSEEKAQREDTIDSIKILRFPAVKLGGESFMYWNFEKEALEYKPDVIIAHNYRQLNTHKALSISKKLKKMGHKCRVILVTHAPFVEGDITRSTLAKIVVRLYDRIIGPTSLKKFDKIVAISHWEIPYLIERGAPKEKIIYIPNGIPEEFFKQKSSKEERKILFFSRISPKKKIDTLIKAIHLLKDKEINVEIVGPAEEDYLREIKGLIKKLKIEKRVGLKEPIYIIRDKIKKIDSAKVFVLPSRVEGMPQALVEALARGKIVIGSNSIAIRDLIRDRENGYLFEFDNPRDLARKIDLALTNDSEEIKKNAKKSVEEFNWRKIIKKIERLINHKV